MTDAVVYDIVDDDSDDDRHADNEHGDDDDGHAHALGDGEVIDVDADHISVSSSLPDGLARWYHNQPITVKSSSAPPTILYGDRPAPPPLPFIERSAAGIGSLLAPLGTAPLGTIPETTGRAMSTTGTTAMQRLQYLEQEAQRLRQQTAGMTGSYAPPPPSLPCAATPNAASLHFSDPYRSEPAFIPFRPHDRAPMSYGPIPPPPPPPYSTPPPAHPRTTTMTDQGNDGFFSRIFGRGMLGGGGANAPQAGDDSFHSAQEPPKPPTIDGRRREEPRHYDEMTRMMKQEEQELKRLETAKFMSYTTSTPLDRWKDEVDYTLEGVGPMVTAIWRQMWTTAIDFHRTFLVLSDDMRWMTPMPARTRASDGRLQRGSNVSRPIANSSLTRSSSKPR